MANFSKILGLASTALVFAGMAFGQNPTCIGGAANQTPLVRVEGTTELVGEYSFTCGTAGITGAGTANILDILSLPVTSKVLNTSGTAYTEAIAVVSVGGVVSSITQGTVSGSQVSFSGVALPAGVSTVTIANIRVNATSLTVGTGTPPAINESAFISGTLVNSSVTMSTAVAYAFTGLSTQTVYKVQTLGSSNKGFFNFLVCQGYKTSAGLVGFIDVGENFATSFKGALPFAGGTNTVLGSEFANNTETGLQPTFPVTPSSGVTNTASTNTMLQIVFSNIPASVTLYVPTTVAADQVGGGSLLLVTSPSNLTAVSASTSSSAAAGTAALTATSGSATAYYEFLPSALSGSTTETFAIGSYVVLTANTVTASSTAMTAAVSFAPVGSTQFPNFVVGPSTTTTTLSTFTQCTTSLLFPFVTNQLGFDTGLAIANTSSDPFGANGATAQAGTCTISFYGAGAPSPSSVTTPNVPSGTVYTAVLSGIGAGFQGYLIAQCNFQYAHGFAFVTDGVGANGGLSQGYLAGVIPDTNQLKRTTANPIGVATAGMGETLGN
jgi:hypothetical protein